MLSETALAMAEQSDETRDVLVTLNAVPFMGAHVAAALEVLGMLPAGHRDNPHAQAELLQAYVRDAKLGYVAVTAAALHARLTALAKWTAAYDPERQSDAQAVLEAAARHPLCQTGAGIGFEAAPFQEMILFIEELPW